MVDGAHGEHDIASLFASKYNELHNVVSFNNLHMKDLQDLQQVIEVDFSHTKILPITFLIIVCLQTPAFSPAYPVVCPNFSGCSCHSPTSSCSQQDVIATLFFALCNAWSFVLS